MLVSLPLFIDVNSKIRFYINLNQYRNTHYHTLNKAKVMFKEMIQDQIDRLPRLHIIKLTYLLYPKTKREIDTNNVCSIADKFFCDALVEAGKLADDNYKYVIDSRFRFAEVDPMNPRVDVLIEETATMKVILSESEIRVALQNFATQYIQGANAKGLVLKATGDTFEASFDVFTNTGSSTAATQEPAAADQAAQNQEPKANISTGEARVDPTPTQQPAVKAAAPTATATTAAPVAQSQPAKEASTVAADAPKPSLLNFTPQAAAKPAVEQVGGAAAPAEGTVAKSLFSFAKPS